MSLHPHSLAQRTEVIVEHFRNHVRPRIGGKAKAMVVAASRLHAVRYKQSFDRYLIEKGYQDIGVLVAFSGKVKDPDDGGEHSESGMNRDSKGESVSEARLPEVFDQDDFHLLIVAEKYQTGFDQPLLHTMYVDKRLSGVHAVQTLSRLNRIHPGKEDTFVLDFVNEAEEIQRAFEPYYEQTAVSETADPEQLLELQGTLEGSHVFLQEEVDGLCRAFVARTRRGDDTHASLYRYLNPAVDRFQALEADLQEEFRNALTAFVRLYAFLAQVMPWRDAELEKLYTYGRLLALRLPKDDRRLPLDLDGDVELEYYRLRQTFDGTILLGEEGPQPLKPATEVGTRQGDDDAVRLSEIIQVLNERFGTEFTQADGLLFDQFVAAARADDEVVERARANPLENFELAMRPRVESLMLDRLEDNQEIVERYLNDAEFQAIAFRLLVKRIYDEIHEAAGA